MIQIPWPPKSYLNGGNRLTKDGRVYKAEAALEASTQSDPLKGPYSIFVMARPKYNRKDSLNSLIKPITDVLIESGIITDDSQIADLRIQRFNPCKPGRVEIMVSGE